MRGRGFIFAVASALLLAAAPAFAQSDAQVYTDAGGTYSKEGSTSFCAFPVGNSDNVKTTEQKGSFKSSHPEEKTNPGGNKPPGQQGGNTLR
jgi:hypothetical protein